MSEPHMIAVKVIPKSTENRILGWENGVLKVKIAAPPEDGKANRALIAFLAQTFQMPQRDIVIVRGENARHKQICFYGKNPLLQEPVQDKKEESRKKGAQKEPYERESLFE